MQAKIGAATGRAVGILAALALGLVSGCGCGTRAPDQPTGKKAHADAVLKVWCDDPQMAGVFVPRAKAWAHRHTATVQQVMVEADADVLFVPPARLGRLDPTTALRPVPASVTGEGSTYQWGGLLGVYQSRLAHWGGDRYAVPLVGEASVLVFRADLLGDGPFAEAFRQKHLRTPLPVRTWDDLADIGLFATERNGKPGLPPLPADPAAAATAFGQIAACYDRPVATGGNLQEAAGPDPYRRGLTFYTDVDVLRNRPADRWEVRVGEPPFGEAFRWFEKTAKGRPAEAGDVIAAVVSGSAVAAVVPVGDLARLPRDPASGAVDSRFGVASVPGADAFYDAAGKRQKTNSVNRVPLYAGSGLMGVVRQSAAHPDAAWALLIELGGPAGSAASVANATVGGGPLRIENASASTAHWEQYGFDAARTADLTTAVSDYVAPGTINPALALRTPDVDAVNALLARAVGSVASGKQSADAGQQQAVKEWREMDAKTPVDVRQTPRRKSAGLD